MSSRFLLLTLKIVLNKYVAMFLMIMKTLLGGRGGGGAAFIRREHLKEGGVNKLFLILGGVFIGGRRLKEGGQLLEDLSYRRNTQT